MSDFPQKGRKLFIKGNNPSEYAYIGWGEMEARFDAYMIGYKEAADLIIGHALSQGDNGTLDSMVFPACFLYRQYLELALKDIYLSNAKVPDVEKIDAIKSHNLRDIWRKAKNLILADFPNDDKKVLEVVEGNIVEFNERDTKSFAFRYPIDKTLNLVHDEDEFIDLPNLVECMDKLANFLSSVRNGMAENRYHES